MAETAYNDALKQKYSGPYPSAVWLIWFPFAFSVITFVWAGNANTRMWVIGCLVLLALAVLGSVLLKVRWETTNRKFAEERDLCKAEMEASKSELERAKDMLAKLDEVKKDKEKKNTSDSNRTIKSDKAASQRKPKKAESSSSETKPRVKNTDVKEKTNTTNITDKTPVKKEPEPNKVPNNAKPDGKNTTKAKSVTTTAATVPNTTKKRTSTKSLLM